MEIKFDINELDFNSDFASIVFSEGEQFGYCRLTKVKSIIEVSKNVAEGRFNTFTDGVLYLVKYNGFIKVGVNFHQNLDRRLSKAFDAHWNSYYVFEGTKDQVIEAEYQIKSKLITDLAFLFRSDKPSGWTEIFYDKNQDIFRNIEPEFGLTLIESCNATYEFNKLACSRFESEMNFIDYEVLKAKACSLFDSQYERFDGPSDHQLVILDGEFELVRYNIDFIDNECIKEILSPQLDLKVESKIKLLALDKYTKDNNLQLITFMVNPYHNVMVQGNKSTLG